MPRIPQYVQEKLASAMTGVPQASTAGLATAGAIADTANSLAQGAAYRASTGNSGRVGNGLAAVAANAFQGISQELRIRRAQQAHVEAQQQAWNDEAAISNASIPIHQKMLDQFRLVQEQHTNAKDMLADWRTTAPAILDEMLQQPDIRGNQERENGIRKSFSSLMSSYDSQLATYGRSKEIDINQGNIKNSLQSIIDFAGKNPDALAFGDAQDQIDKLIPSMSKFFNAPEAAALVRDARAKSTESWTRGLIDENTQEARKLLTTQAWVKNGTISRESHDRLVNLLEAKEKDNLQVLDSADKLKAQGIKQQINDLYDAARTTGDDSAFMKALQGIDKIIADERKSGSSRSESAINFGIERSDQLRSRKSDAELKAADDRARAAQAQAIISHGWAIESHNLLQAKRELDKIRSQPENQEKLKQAALSFGRVGASFGDLKTKTSALNDAFEKNEAAVKENLIDYSDYLTRAKYIEQKRQEEFNKIKFKNGQPIYNDHKPFLGQSVAEKAASSQDLGTRFGYELSKGAPTVVQQKLNPSNDPSKQLAINARFMSELVRNKSLAESNGLGSLLLQAPPPETTKGKKRQSTLQELIDKTAQYMVNHPEEFK